MHELAAIKDINDNIFYIIYYNKKYNELFVIPKYKKINENYTKIKNKEEIYENYKSLIKKSKYLKREAMIMKKSLIKIYYNPIARLKEIYNNPKDKLEEKVKMLVEILMERSKEDLESFGIGGSILVSLHREESDIDLAYYGKEYEKIYNVLKELRKEKILKELNDEFIKKLYLERNMNKIIEFEKFEKIEKRKIIEGTFENTIYSIKIIYNYEEEPLKLIGNYKGILEVIDSSLSYTFPSIYIARNSENTYKVISYKLRFTEMAFKGEKILVRGKLEKGKRGDMRIIIAEEGDYIMPVSV